MFSKATSAVGHFCLFYLSFIFLLSLSLSPSLCLGLSLLRHVTSLQCPFYFHFLAEHRCFVSVLSFVGGRGSNHKARKQRVCCEPRVSPPRPPKEGEVKVHLKGILFILCRRRQREGEERERERARGRGGARRTEKRRESKSDQFCLYWGRMHNGKQREHASEWKEKEKKQRNRKQPNRSMRFGYDCEESRSRRRSRRRRRRRKKEGRRKKKKHQKYILEYNPKKNTYQQTYNNPFPPPPPPLSPSQTFIITHHPPGQNILSQFLSTPLPPPLNPRS